MIQPVHLTPRVQQHLQDVMSSLALYVSVFVFAIIFGSIVDPTFWSTFMVLSLFGSIGTIFLTVVSSANKRVISCGVPFFLGLGSAPIIVITSIIDPGILIFAGLGTVLIFCVMYYHAMNVPVGQYEATGGLLYSSLATLIYVGIFSMLLGSEWLDTFELLIGLMLFSAFIAYDTNMMITRAHTHVVTEENREMFVIMDSMNLFLDAVNLFIRLIRLAMKVSKKRSN